MIVRDVTPPGSFGKVFGFVTTGFNIGGIVSPLIFGAIMDHGSPRLVFRCGGRAGDFSLVRDRDGAAWPISRRGRGIGACAFDGPLGLVKSAELPHVRRLPAHGRRSFRPHSALVGG